MSVPTIFQRFFCEPDTKAYQVVEGREDKFIVPDWKSIDQDVKSVREDNKRLAKDMRKSLEAYTSERG